MQSTPSFIAALIVAGLVSTLGPTAHAAGEPATSPSALAAGADRSPIAARDRDREIGVVLDHVMVDDENPGFIVPCVRVLRKLYNKARHDDDLIVRIDVAYTSSDGPVERTFFVPLAAMVETTHHEQSTPRSWMLLDSTLDVSDAPVSGDMAVTATVVMQEEQVAGRP